MLRRSLLRAGLLGALALAGVAPSAPAAAQAVVEDIIGTWNLVSVTLDRGGQKGEPFGSSPQGILILDPTRSFALVVTRSDGPGGRPGGPGGPRGPGPGGPGPGGGQGSIAYFGTYNVEGANLVFQIQGSTLPQLAGTTQTRAFQLAGDDLTYSAVQSAQGAGTTTLVWKRAR